MSQPNAFLILGDHPFLNYIFFGGQTRLFNTAGNYNPNLTLQIWAAKATMAPSISVKKIHLSGLESGAPKPFPPWLVWEDTGRDEHQQIADSGFLNTIGPATKTSTDGPMEMEETWSNMKQPYSCWQL